jgi:alpha/beta superfamily hydrolase
LKPASQQRFLIDGPAGKLDIVVNDPGAEAGTDPERNRRGLAFVAHPHPLFGGTLDNKVVQTLAKTFHAQGCVAVRMNFRGVGASDGVHDEGNGETEDWLIVADEMRSRYGPLPLLLAGFSFGAYVQARVAKRLLEMGTPAARLVLVAPAVGRFHLEPVTEGTLVIHGESDDVVPLPEVLAWARPQRLPVVVLPGAGHFFHGSLMELQRIVQHSCSCLAAG